MSYTYENYDNFGRPTEPKENGKKANKIITGLFFLVMAALLIVGKLGIIKISLHGISIWRLIFTALFIMIGVDGIKKRKLDDLVVAAAGLFIVYRKCFDALNGLSTFTVIVAAILVIIGLNVLFPKKEKPSFDFVGNTGKNDSNKTGNECAGKENNHKQVFSEDRCADYVKYNNSFGNSIKYLDGEIDKISLINSFGNFDLYLTEANPINLQGQINLSSSFGDVNIYVPAEWNAMINVKSSFGSVEEKGRGNSEASCKIFIKGAVSFGNLKVHYVEK